jgi:hypothetical protein
METRTPSFVEYVNSSWSESHPGAPTMECRFEEPAPEETSVFTSFMKAKV